MTDDDLIKHAEAAITLAHSPEGMGTVFVDVAERLLAAVKAARAENKRLKVQLTLGLKKPGRR